jgi:hypothetical protein
MRKIHGPQLEDPRLVPFKVDAAYATGGGTMHGMYVKLSIVLNMGGRDFANTVLNMGGSSEGDGSGTGHDTAP